MDDAPSQRLLQSDPVLSLWYPRIQEVETDPFAFHFGDEINLPASSGFPPVEPAVWD
jgi:hypothetical protein